MPSIADICNLALMRAGAAETLGDPFDPADRSREAVSCRRGWPLARDTTLEAGFWPFAQARTPLAELTAVREPWRHAYAIPHDCLVPRELVRVLPGTPIVGTIPPWLEWCSNRRDWAYEPAPAPFAIEVVAGRRVLLADAEGVELAYTARVEDPTLYTPLFVDAAAWRLAGELAMAITGQSALRNDCLAAWRSFLEMARLEAANTGVEPPRPLPAAIRARS